MRKALRILAVALSLTLVVSVAQAAVKAGSACSKLGSTSTVSGKKYTCIKSGKKLVWNKGVVVVKPTPVATATPTPTPTPTPTATPTATPTPTPTPTPKPIVLGDPCERLGNVVTSTSGEIVCSEVANRKMAYLEVTTGLTNATNPKSPDSIEVCRIPDARTGTKTAPTIAYPIKQDWVRGFSGVRRVAVVGFDFPDVPGTGNPLDILSKDLDQAARFIKWYSNGKVTLEFKTYDKWIRLGKSSDNYALGDHFTSASALTVEQMGDDFTQATKSKINIDGFQAIWYVTPKEVTKIYESFGLARGTMAASIYGINAKSYKLSTAPWTFFIHEMLHDLGLQGHSPKEPWVYGVLLNGNGLSSSMNTWDELVVDWLAADEVYCVDKNNLKTVDLQLASIDRQQAGLHSVMVKLDQYRVLIVESHKPGDFSPGMPQGVYGLTLQLVDTRIDTTWNDAQATSVYVKMNNNHWGFPPYGTRIIGGEQSSASLWNGMGIVGGVNGVDTNWLLLQGESYTFEGVGISFIKAGDTDSIRIEKVG